DLLPHGVLQSCLSILSTIFQRLHLQSYHHPNDRSVTLIVLQIRRPHITVHYRLAPASSPSTYVGLNAAGRQRTPLASAPVLSCFESVRHSATFPRKRARSSFPDSTAPSAAWI